MIHRPEDSQVRLFDETKDAERRKGRGARAEISPGEFGLLTPKG
jgi:hypothetical protein